MKNNTMIISCIIVFLVSLGVLIYSGVTYNTQKTNNKNETTKSTQETTNNNTTNNTTNSKTSDSKDENLTEYYIQETDYSPDHKIIRKNYLMKEEVEQLEVYLKEMRDPTAEEMVDMGIYGPISLKYKDDITILFDRNYPEYCAYYSKDKNSTLQIIPVEFHSWALSVLDR